MKQVYNLDVLTILSNPRDLSVVGVQNKKMKKDLELPAIAFAQDNLESVSVKTTIAEKIRDALIEIEHAKDGEFNLSLSETVEWSFRFTAPIDVKSKKALKALGLNIVDDAATEDKHNFLQGLKKPVSEIMLKVMDRVASKKSDAGFEADAVIKVYQNMDFKFTRDINNCCSLKISPTERQIKNIDSSILCGELIRSSNLGWFDVEDQSDMWVSRYLNFLIGLMGVLKFVQNKGGLEGLTLEKFNELIGLESIKSKLQEWSSLYGDDFKEVSKDLTAHIESLPGYRENDLQKLMEQYGFIAMQLQRIISQIRSKVEVGSLDEFISAELKIYGKQTSTGLSKIFFFKKYLEREGLIGMENLQGYRGGCDLRCVANEILKDVMSEPKVADI